jgi:sulfate adenylyltransferase
VGLSVQQQACPIKWQNPSSSGQKILGAQAYRHQSFKISCVTYKPAFCQHALMKPLLSEEEKLQLNMTTMQARVVDLRADQVARLELHLMGALPARSLSLLAQARQVADAHRGEALVLCDPEGVRLAVMQLETTSAGPQEEWVQLEGTFKGLELPRHYDFRTLRKCPETLERKGSAGALAVFIGQPLRPEALGHLQQQLEHGQPLLWFICSVPAGADDEGHYARVRALAAQADSFKQSHACTHTALLPCDLSKSSNTECEQMAQAFGARYLEVEQAAPNQHKASDRGGLTVFFTGFSGSGKSTVANVLLARLMERGGPAVTLLDGDLVRKNLSSGLTFSREDRNTNIRRIGFVASLITKSGGIAICAPIAPYDGVRKEVRQTVEAVGSFVLVHISTPLEACEARDRKGLYAKARKGLIPEFTGISDPYDTPADAQLSIDTTQMSAEEAADQVLKYLLENGLLPPEG